MSIVQVAVTGVVGAVFDLFFGEMETPTQRLDDISRQTAKEGEPRQIIFGIVRPIGGNLVAVQEPPRIERRKQKSGGKGGGGGSSQTVEIPRRTYAVGICEGPITGIRRAWRNNKLVYDGRGTEWGAKNNGTFLSRFQFYLGDWDQMPSPNLEAVFGAGNVPAMRGTCYMVAKDEDLQDTGGAVPQWIFEVERAYGYGLTSRPYQVETSENISPAPDATEVTPSKLPVYTGAQQEYFAATPSVFEITISDNSPKPKDYFAPTPAVTRIKASEIARSGAEYFAPAPAVLSLDYSISYTDGIPDYFAPTPSIIEVTLT